MPAIILAPIGAAMPLVLQRSSDAIKYTVDCSTLLDANELIVSIDKATTSSTDITLTGSRSRKGISLEFTLRTLNIPGPESVEYGIHVTFITTFNNIKSIAFKARIYK